MQISKVKEQKNVSREALHPGSSNVYLVENSCRNVLRQLTVGVRQSLPLIRHEDLTEIVFDVLLNDVLESVTLQILVLLTKGQPLFGEGLPRTERFTGRLNSAAPRTIIGYFCESFDGNQAGF